MIRGSNAAKVQEWTERLGRFGKSNETVAAFCAGEGVSTPSFYLWKRRLALSSGSPKPASKRRTQRGHKSKNGNSNAFTRLTVVDEASSPTVITLPGGIKIQLGADPATTATVIQQLLQHAVHDQGLNCNELKPC
jgi:hypothetical protein